MQRVLRVGCGTRTDGEWRLRKGGLRAIAIGGRIRLLRVGPDSELCGQEDALAGIGRPANRRSTARPTDKRPWEAQVGHSATVPFNHRGIGERRDPMITHAGGKPERRGREPGQVDAAPAMGEGVAMVRGNLAGIRRSTGRDGCTQERHEGDPRRYLHAFTRAQPEAGPCLVIQSGGSPALIRATSPLRRGKASPGSRTEASGYSRPGPEQTAHFWR